VGPLARTVGDAALLLEVIAGPALAPPGYAGGDPPPDLRGRTVGLLTQLVEAGCDPEIAGATRAAAALLESLGAEVRPVELPRLEHLDAIHPKPSGLEPNYGPTTDHDCPTQRTSTVNDGQ
jgi:aspartyl-tRNA(Asn)/glutamyl-tRNA(Gln) amidotransferase subunit A